MVGTSKLGSWNGHWSWWILSCCRQWQGALKIAPWTSLDRGQVAGDFPKKHLQFGDFPLPCLIHRRYLVIYPMKISLNAIRSHWNTIEPPFSYGFSQITMWVAHVCFWKMFLHNCHSLMFLGEADNCGTCVQLIGVFGLNNWRTMF